MSPPLFSVQPRERERECGFPPHPTNTHVRPTSRASCRPFTASYVATPKATAEPRVGTSVSVRPSVRPFVAPSSRTASYVCGRNTEVAVRDGRQGDKGTRPDVWTRTGSRRLALLTRTIPDNRPALFPLGARRANMKQSSIPSYVITRIVPSRRQTTDREFATLSAATQIYVSCGRLGSRSWCNRAYRRINPAFGHGAR